MLNFEEFIQKMKSIHAVVTTKSSAEYRIKSVDNHYIHYMRGSREFFKGKYNPLIEHLPMLELYNAYLKEDIVNTKTIRTHFKGSQYAAAAAFLKDVGLFDKKTGKRI